MEGFNRTIIAAVRHYIGDHARHWDLFTVPLTYAYSTEAHTSKRLVLFDIVLSRPPPHLILQGKLDMNSTTSPRKFYTLYLYRVRSLTATVRTEMRKKQEGYRKNFDERVRNARTLVIILSSVLLRKDHITGDDPRHKKASMTTGALVVGEVDEKTCVTTKPVHTRERVALDRAVLPPQRAPQEVRSTAHSVVTSKSVRTPSSDKDMSSTMEATPAKPFRSPE